MAWTMLPDDMEELILGTLSLVELGRVSTTCPRFHGSFSRRMTELQKARCDLAVECFGRGTIPGIGRIVRGFIKGFTNPGRSFRREWHCCRFSPGRPMQVEGEADPEMPGYQRSEAGEALVMVKMHSLSYSEPPHAMQIRVPAPDQAWVNLWADLAERKVEITVGGNRDLVSVEGLALVQALLTSEFWPKPEACPRVDVIIQRVGSTRAERQAQIAPLLHLGAQLTTLCIYWWD